MYQIFLCLFICYTLRGIDPNTLFQHAQQAYQNAQYDTALNDLDTLLIQYPTNVSVLYFKALCLQETARNQDMIQICERIVKQDPHHSHAHQLLADGYRIRGEFQRGWREYLWRFKNPEYAITSLDLTQLRGKRVAIHVEGKIGDNIHFVRYAKLLKDLGATVIVQANTIVFKLFELCDYIDEIVSEPIPPVDILLWQQNLPLIFNTTLENVPAPIPYLRADPQLVDHWHQQIAHDRNFTIGICWQSSPDLFLEKKPFTRRSIPLSLLSTLAEIPGVSLYSLQQIDGLDQLHTVPTHRTIHTFDNIDTQNGPFMDTAAIMKNLDLIITVDTSLAHLAGALGVPVWVMLPTAYEWRWMHDRADSPWYPTMRLFRQKTPGMWESVIQEIMQEIKTLVRP